MERKSDETPLSDDTFPAIAGLVILVVVVAVVFGGVIYMYAAPAPAPQTQPLSAIRSDA